VETSKSLCARNLIFRAVGDKAQLLQRPAAGAIYMMKSAIRWIRVAGLVAIGLAAAGQAEADAVLSLNCESGCSNDLFGGAVWSTEIIFHPSGTGVFQPFLRVHGTGNQGTEDGHNTDAPKQQFLNDEIGGIWTHSVNISDLTPVTPEGYTGLYYGFALDFGEPATEKKSLLSLDSLKICTANSATLTQADDCPTQPYKYDLDAGTDREVLLDYNLIGQGNGASDLFVYIPFFETSDQYLYLYSMFGLKGGSYRAEGTFAEWAFIEAPPAQVPEPGFGLLLWTGLVGLITHRYRRS
jgi:hypothetical protein